jgi:hypothetical protein
VIGAGEAEVPVTVATASHTDLGGLIEAAAVGSLRRVIAATSDFADVDDITTLANPEVVDQIRHQVQAAKRAHGDAPRELTGAEIAALKSFGTG